MIAPDAPKLPDHVVMRRVISTNISRIGHDPVAQHLYVDFGKPDKPSVYRHDGVSAEKYAAFNAAPSKGAHHHQVFKGKHPTVKVSAPAWSDEPQAPRPAAA